jgi:hypothetical protein
MEAVASRAGISKHTLCRRVARSRPALLFGVVVAGHLLLTFPLDQR